MTHTAYVLQASAASNLDCSTQIVSEQVIAQAELEGYLGFAEKVIKK
ncbi:MAG: hypothetical protein AAF383_29050 [Cyanobacteria bacterium P01_A01_bin.83]